MQRLFRTPVLSLAAVFCALSYGCHSTHSSSTRNPTEERVGPAGANRYVTPANQILTPAGLTVELPGLRPQALALSPDGKILVTSGKTSELVVIDPKGGRILQRVKLPLERDVEAKPDPVSGNILAPDKGGQLSYTGLIFSSDGTRLYLANVDGSVKVFAVDK